MNFRLKTNADDLKRRFDNLPSGLVAGRKEAIRQTIELGNDILKLMQIGGMKPSYPIHWDTPKQQKAFFATDGFGGGIPTARTGEHVSQWKALPLQNGVSVQNLKRGSIFLWGTAKGGQSPASGGQSRIHLGRWPSFHDAAMSVLVRWSEGGWQKVRQAFLEGFMKDFRK